jgi:Ca2+-binding EF-hand superfamily protein
LLYFLLEKSKKKSFDFECSFQVAIRALGFEPKKDEIKKLLNEIDRDQAGKATIVYKSPSPKFRLVLI